MNSSIRAKSQSPGEAEESRFEKIRRIRDQVGSGFYSRVEVLRDVADALLMNPEPFENLNEKRE